MNDIDPKALEHACQCAGRSVHHLDRMALDLPLRASIVAHARAIEQHEAFRQEVSAMLIDEYGEEFCRGHSRFARFILAEPDPLVEALKQLKMSYVDAEDFRAALAVRGLEIREKDRV